jgi:hypothetical protein
VNRVWIKNLLLSIYDLRFTIYFFTR